MSHLFYYVNNATFNYFRELLAHHLLYYVNKLRFYEYNTSTFELQILLF